MQEKYNEDLVEDQEKLHEKSKEYIQTFKNFSKILNSNTKYNEPKNPPLNHTYPIQI